MSVDDGGPEAPYHARQRRNHARVQPRPLAQVVDGDGGSGERRFEALRECIEERDHFGFEPSAVQTAGQRYRHALRARPPQRCQHLQHPDLHAGFRGRQGARDHSVMMRAISSHVALWCSQVSVDTPTAHTRAATVHRARSGGGMDQTKNPSTPASRAKTAIPMAPDSTRTERNVLCATYWKPATAGFPSHGSTALG